MWTEKAHRGVGWGVGNSCAPCISTSFAFYLNTAPLCSLVWLCTSVGYRGKHSQDRSLSELPCSSHLNPSTLVLLGSTRSSRMSILVVLPPSSTSEPTPPSPNLCWNFLRSWACVYHLTWRSTFGDILRFMKSKKVSTRVPMTFFYNFDLFAASVLLFLEGHGNWN